MCIYLINVPFLSLNIVGKQLIYLRKYYLSVTTFSFLISIYSLHDKHNKDICDVSRHFTIFCDISRTIYLHVTLFLQFFFFENGYFTMSIIEIASFRDIRVQFTCNSYLNVPTKKKGGGYFTMFGLDLASSDCSK